MTREERIAKDYGEIKMKRGRWYLLKEHGEVAHGLWHQCEKGESRPNLDFATWVVRSSHTDKPMIPNWRCGCRAIPPATIVACWRLLEPDHTSEEIAESELYDKEWVKEAESDEPWKVMDSWSLTPHIMSAGSHPQHEVLYMHDIGDLLGH